MPQPFPINHILCLPRNLRRVRGRHARNMSGHLTNNPAVSLVWYILSSRCRVVVTGLSGRLALRTKHIFKFFCQQETGERLLLSFGDYAVAVRGGLVNYLVKVYNVKWTYRVPKGYKTCTARSIFSGRTLNNDLSPHPLPACVTSSRFTRPLEDRENNKTSTCDVLP